MAVFLKNFYSSIQQYSKLQELAFDEGPIIYDTTVGKNSSSINTREIDQFRQGVEITQEIYTLGMAKISAGTPGHIIKPSCYGINNTDIISTGSFIEIENFDPVKYLFLQQPGADFATTITFPIITADSNQVENYNLNGIIEPLSIRQVISFFSIEWPYEAHAFRGSLMAGNLDNLKFSSDRILTVDYVPKKLIPIKALATGSINTRGFVNAEFYLDAIEFTKSGNNATTKQIESYINDNINYSDPFVDSDSRNYLSLLGITELTHGADMVAVFKLMTGSTDNYVPPGKKSATAGFVYDNIGYAGTDSIAFGGMTY